VSDVGPLRILVGIDGSPAAEVAVELVATQSWPDGSHVVVVEAVEIPGVISAVPGTPLAFVDVADIESDIRAAAGQTVEAARARIVASGLTAEGRVLAGRPASTLADEATAIGADLIVVGSRGHGTIETMVLGSVSAELVEHASIPVLVARGSTADRVALAWDGSASAQAAADLLHTWPSFATSEVTVVTVTDVGPPWWTGFDESSPSLVPMYLDAAEAARARDRDLANAMADELRRAGLQAHAEPREGDPADQILAAARDGAVDLVVMGTRGRTGLARLVLGSVARNVVTHAPCSVLVVHHTARAINPQGG
jgi:nucleotide-binding universal stress UspA family protein